MKLIALFVCFFLLAQMSHQEKHLPQPVRYLDIEFTVRRIYLPFKLPSVLQVAKPTAPKFGALMQVITAIPEKTIAQSRYNFQPELTWSMRRRMLFKP